MPHDDEPRPRTRCDDVRLRGFSDRVSIEQAIAWIDARSAALPPVTIEAAQAIGRVVSSPIEVEAEVPPADRAAEDGYAIRSRETIGAGSYNPLPFSIQDATAPLASGSAALVTAGAALPQGADAVLPFGAAQRDGGTLEVLGTVSEGTGVERRGQQVRAGATLIQAMQPLRPQDVGLLAVLGIGSVRVIRCPRVRLVIAKPKGPATVQDSDGNGPMLQALVERDGGVVESIVAGTDERRAIGEAIGRPGADVVLVAGRTGTGFDDEAPLALADVGEVAIHGIALRPGGSTAMGLAGSACAVLLPGNPLACLCAYELIAGRLVRRLGGRDPALPHATREVEVGRKFVSAVGFVDVCQVRIVDERAEPIGSPEDGGLASAVRADGFVVVPAPLEGYGPGARVIVHVYANGATR